MRAGSGTTSAYAENTLGNQTLKPLFWNYLRVRGEYGMFNHTYTLKEELPPRTRRILEVRKNDVRLIGTTSAYAENTKSPTKSVGA